MKLINIIFCLYLQSDWSASAYYYVLSCIFAIGTLTHFLLGSPFSVLCLSKISSTKTEQLLFFIYFSALSLSFYQGLQRKWNKNSPCAPSNKIDKGSFWYYWRLLKSCPSVRSRAIRLATFWPHRFIKIFSVWPEKLAFRAINCHFRGQRWHFLGFWFPFWHLWVL